MGLSGTEVSRLVFTVLLSFQVVLPSPVPPTVATEDDADDYLSRFGYMGGAEASDPRLDQLMEDDPAEARRQALLAFQEMANIPMTGVLDDATREMMNMPRCGVPDNVNMASLNKRRKRYVLQGSTWDSTDLKYRIDNYSPDLPRQTIQNELAEAFDMWAQESQLEFSETTNTDEDIEVRFATGRHGDGAPFDGQGGTLAHAFFPQYGGDTHFDDDERFTSRSSSGVNFLQVATHEIGHAIGLSHSSVSSSVMAPFYRGYESNFQLDPDDIMGVRALYGAPDTPTPSTPAPPPTSPPSSTPAPSTTPPPSNVPSSTAVASTSPPTPAPTDPPTIDPTLCNLANFDAITTYERAGRRVIYAFKGNYVIRLSGAGSPEVVPFDQSVFRPGPSGDIDGASYWPAGNVYSGGRWRYLPARTYLFKGDLYWRYGYSGLASGYPRYISSGFPGIPDNIDGTMRWTPRGEIYFFKGNQYYRYDRGAGVPRSYPRHISRWSGLPSDGIDAVVELGFDSTYFFKDDKIYHFSSWDYEVSPGFPKITKDFLFGCDGSQALGMLVESGFRLVETNSNSTIDTEMTSDEDNSRTNDMTTSDGDLSGRNTKKPGDVSGQSALRAMPFGLTTALVLVLSAMM